MSDKVKHPVFWTVFLSIVSLAWVYPIVLVLINSFKQKAYISRNAFSLPTGKAFVGLENYIRGIERTNLISSFGWTVVITVGAVLLIIVCAWWIVRTNNWAARLLYTLFLFNMIVPFQMVMFTLSKLADMMGLNTPWGLWIVYLGFGAGLAVFIFTGVIKGIPQELEESAMIDGASVPRIFFQIVIPMSRPILVYTIISSFLTPWTDFVVAKMILNSGVSSDWTVAIGLYNMLQKTLINNYFALFCAGGVLVSIPISILFVIMQKFYVEGITSGAAKG